MIKKLVLLALMLPFFTQAVLAEESPASESGFQIASVEHVVWDKLPIAFVVPVGEERLLAFPSSVKFEGSQAAGLTKDLVTVLNNDGTLYVKANQAFSPIRVPVVLTETGQTILIDLSAKPNVSNAPLQVIIRNPEDKLADAVEPVNASESYTFPTLIRYVAQRTCAECGPKSAQEPLTNILRSPMNTNRFVDLFSYRYNVVSMPLASWRSGIYYATAVRVKNLSHESIDLSAQTITGSWRAVSFLPSNHLEPAGEFNDRVTIILVSEAPFASTLAQTRGYFNE